MRQRIKHLDQLLPIIDEKDEIILIDKGWYQVVDYVYVDSDTFDTKLAHECRGIKFDAKGNLIARPFHKFFNLGEKKQAHEVNWDAPHTTMLKMDGSMIHTVFDEHGDIRAMTRKGLTDVAQTVEELFFPRKTSSYDDYCLLAGLCMRTGFTPIFEYTSPHNRIVIPYETPMLTLLAIRHNNTGVYMERIAVERYARKYGIPVVRNFLTDPETMISRAREFTDEEGIVVQFDHGLMIKVKADEYVIKHRAVSDLDSKKKVLAVVFSDTVDDFLPLVGEIDRSELLAFRDDVNRQIRFMVDAMEAIVKDHGHLPRKEYAELIFENVSNKFTSVAFAAYDKKDIREAAMHALTRNPEYLQAKWRGE